MKRKFLFFIFQFICMFLLLPFLLSAQEGVSTILPLKADENVGVQAQMQRDWILLDQPIEKAIDPAEYIVGPGDVFTINLWGMDEQSFSVKISPEGYLLIPHVNEIFVTGMKLADVKKNVLREMEKVYNNPEVNIHLVKIRRFRVHVLGEVKNPGVYVASPTDRIVTVIKQAGGLTNLAFEVTVQIKHVNGSVDTLNLYRFAKLGSIDDNPFVESGDVIYIPAMDLNKKTIYIESDIKGMFGVYQIKDDDKLGEFLYRNRILNKIIDYNNAYLIRKSPEKQMIKLNLRGTSQESIETLNMPIQDGDVISIRQVNNNVYIRGQVYRPGPYPYVSNLTARDYVKIAGARDKAAEMDALIVIRLKDGSKEKGGDIIIQKGDTIIVPNGFKANFLEYASIILTASNLIVAIFTLRELANR